MAAACEAFPWVQTHAVRRRITVTADPEHPELGHSSCQATGKAWSSSLEKGWEKSESEKMLQFRVSV